MAKKKTKKKTTTKKVTKKSSKKKVTKKKLAKKSSQKKATTKKPRRKTTRICCGTSRERGKQYIGSKVSKIRAQLKVTLRIPSGARSYANGQLVTAKYVLQEEDTLEFILKAGKHG